MRSSTKYMEAQGMVLVNERCLHIHIISPAEMFFLLIQCNASVELGALSKQRLARLQHRMGNLVEMWMSKPPHRSYSSNQSL